MLGGLLCSGEHAQDEDGVDVGEDVLKGKLHAGTLQHEHVLELTARATYPRQQPAEGGAHLPDGHVVVEDDVEGKCLAEGLGADQLGVRVVVP